MEELVVISVLEVSNKRSAAAREGHDEGTNGR